MLEIQRGAIRLLYGRELSISIVFYDVKSNNSMANEVCPIEWNVPWGVHVGLIIAGLVFLLLAIRYARTRGQARVDGGWIGFRTPIVFVLSVSCFLLGAILWIFFVVPAAQKWAIFNGYVQELRFPIGRADYDYAYNAPAPLPLSLIASGTNDTSVVSVQFEGDVGNVAVCGNFKGDCPAALFRDICDRNRNELKCRFDAAAKVFHVCRTGDQSAACS